MSTYTTGVFPVYDIKLYVNTSGRTQTPTWYIVRDMESISVSMDSGVEEWNPMDQGGWVRRLTTSKGFSITMNGKRHYGDPGNDYIAQCAWGNGRDCDSEFKIIFPNGDTLYGDCVIAVKTPFGGDSTNVDSLEFEMQSDGKPTYTAATHTASTVTITCPSGATCTVTRQGWPITSGDTVTEGDVLTIVFASSTSSSTATCTVNSTTISSGDRFRVGSTAVTIIVTLST